MPELPVLDETRCTGCSDCVRVCPTECLEMAGPGGLTGRHPPLSPWLPRPLDCISCELCVLVCPEDALRLATPGSMR